jgi:hypothetical protein
MDVRSMLLELGAPRYIAEMAIPMSWFLVGTTDPDEPATIEIVKSIQRGLHSLGYKRVHVSGVLDQETAGALSQISGRRWMHKTWLQVMGDVINAKRNPSQKALEMSIDRSASQARGALGSYFEYEGLPPGPLPGYKVGLPPGPLGMGDTATDAGIPLTYGEGSKNASNMVPTDGDTRAIFKNLQKQINRNLAPLGKRVGVDGIIGEHTRKGALAAKSRYQKNRSYIVNVSASTVSMAANAVTLGKALKEEADAHGIGASAVANVGAVTTSDSTKGPLTKEEADRKILVGKVTSVLPWVALAGGVAFGAAWWNKRRKKGKR